MPRFKLNKLPDLDNLKGDVITYGALTCWWFDAFPDYQTETGLPCDPRGGVLMQTGDIKAFIEAAKGNTTHYGEHGIDAFRAAYHGVIEVLKVGDGSEGPEGKDRWVPTAFDNWVDYNKALTMTEGREGGEFEL